MFVELNYSRNTVIYAEKDVVKHVYLIREGEIEIS
jgi:CRP-like cAMP-binding protein